jgi:hypothetical protein
MLATQITNFTTQLALLIALVTVIDLEREACDTDNNAQEETSY